MKENTDDTDWVGVADFFNEPSVQIPLICVIRVQ